MATRIPGPVEQELTDRFWYLADPRTRFTLSVPTRRGSASLLLDHKPGTRTYQEALSRAACDVLVPIIRSDEQLQWPYSRQEALWLLEDAIEEARERGL